MNTPTAARTQASESSHWYFPDGTPAYTVLAKGTGLPRPTTLRDARQLGLLPSTTTILKALDKPALTSWLIENACLAVLTTPRPPEESLDAFVKRVLQEDRVQDEESQRAKDLGTGIHDAMEAAFKGEHVQEDLLSWVSPACEFVKNMCPTVVALETVLVGQGYAGRTDFIGDDGECELMLDWKSAKKLPERGAWVEHRWQLASYAMARSRHSSRRIRTGNVYISTTEMGRFAYFDNPPWEIDYACGFAPLVQVWSHLNNYRLPSMLT